MADRRHVDALAKILRLEARVSGSFEEAPRDSRAFYRKLARGILKRFDLYVRCRVCGCTELDCFGCIRRTGEPCHWREDLEDDSGPICSACVPEEVARG